jgi:hypothetical protein
MAALTAISMDIAVNLGWLTEVRVVEPATLPPP